MKWIQPNSSLGLFLLRLFIGLRLLYGVVDNILSWGQMNEFSEFLRQFNFPFPIVSALISVYVQFFGSIMILTGFKIRWAALLLTINFLIAILVVHLGKDSVEVMTPALAMLFGCLTLYFTGPGKYAVGI